MTLEEFLEIIDVLPHSAHRGEYSNRYYKAAKQAGFDKPSGLLMKLAEAYFRELFKKEQIKITPQLIEQRVVNEDGKYLLGPFLKKVWENRHNYAFEDCNEPETLLSFCDPLDGKWEKTVADLNPAQLNLWSLIRSRIRERSKL